jgi:Rieske Fe-S protein
MMSNAVEQATAPSLPERRSFLTWLTYGLGGLAGLALAVPLLGYLFGPLRKKPQALWVKLGAPGSFPVDQTRLVTFENKLGTPWDGMAAQMGVYVRNRGAKQFQIFAMNCAHLGCPVTWFPQSGLFLCPCHGGVYYENGARASGPPERGLFECNWRINDGQLEVQAPHLPTLQNTLKESESV